MAAGPEPVFCGTCIADHCKKEWNDPEPVFPGYEPARAEDLPFPSVIRTSSRHEPCTRGRLSSPATPLRRKAARAPHARKASRAGSFGRLPCRQTFSGSCSLRAEAGAMSSVAAGWLSGRPSFPGLFLPFRTGCRSAQIRAGEQSPGRQAGRVCLRATLRRRSFRVEDPGDGPCFSVLERERAGAGAGGATPARSGYRRAFRLLICRQIPMSMSISCRLSSDLPRKRRTGMRK